MIASGIFRFRTAIVLACAAGSLGAVTLLPAQGSKKGGGPAKCDAEDDNSAESISGRLFLSRATDAKTSADDKGKALRQAVGALGGKFDRNKDFGRDYLLGEALVLFVTEPGTSTVGPRSSFGFKDDPSGQIDVLATADTILTALETGKPACAQQAAAIRQQAYVPMTNAAIQALNAGQVDSAAALAQRAVGIYKGSPYVYNVLGGVAVKKGDLPAAARNYRQVVELSGTDTTYAKLKSQAMYNLAVVTENRAENASGPEKKAISDSAVALWRAYIAANPSDANGQAGLTHALQTSGDSAAAGQLSADMIANPSKYSDVQLFQSASAAARANRDSEAVKLFEAGLKVNPYYNQALYFVANTYFNGNQPDKLWPVVRRLVEVDPTDSANYRLLAGAYQLRAKADKTPASKKADQDSLLAALKKWKQPTVQVTVTKVVHDGDKIQVAGHVDNLTAAPKTYALKFQFLDATGKVLATQDAPPLAVGPHASQDFDVSANQPGVVSYKYAPLE
jgi:tetratricopeptide (TPR) repeat protein